jgi:hypothetical protein
LFICRFRRAMAPNGQAELLCYGYSICVAIGKSDSLSVVCSDRAGIFVPPSCLRLVCFHGARIILRVCFASHPFSRPRDAGAGRPPSSTPGSCTRACESRPAGRGMLSGSPSRYGSFGHPVDYEGRSLPRRSLLEKERQQFRSRRGENGCFRPEWCAGAH